MESTSGEACEPHIDDSMANMVIEDKATLLEKGQSTTVIL